MAEVTEKIDPRWAWAPYRPSDRAPWDLRRVGHLYRRASFGATYAELQAGLKAGPEKAVAGLLHGGPGLEQFDATVKEWTSPLGRANNGQQIRAWWLYRMLYSTVHLGKGPHAAVAGPALLISNPHPLQEKMTLFWHNHFATSNAKVQNAALMLGQYELMRRHALGNFATMLQEMSKDPAMMVWLDTRGSKKGSPNENYARELMELFSLGIGNYTEKDVREAARAFTGWDVVGNQAAFNPSQHDDGEKTVLGRKGKWKGEDVVRICLEQRSAPYFIVGKLYRFLVSETVPATPELLAPLVEQFKKSGYDFGGLVKTVLSSNLFFSPTTYRSRVKSPVDFTLGIVRTLEGRIGTTNLADALDSLGQNLFNPPSVKGWDGGAAWLNGQTLLVRQNLALALTSTEDVRFGSRTDPAELARKYNKKEEELVDFFLTLFLQGDVPAESRRQLLDYQRRAKTQSVPVYWSASDAADHRVRALCHLVLTLPEFQLD